MGLDMYLFKAYLVGHYLRRNGVEKKGQTVSVEGVALPVKLKSVDRVVSEQAYWRKAYPIDRWITDNAVASGEVVNTEEVFVRADKLVELRQICKRLLKSRSIHEAKKVLPPDDISDYGMECYWGMLKDTVSQLKDVKSEGKDPFPFVQYTYLAWW